jgi:hypothetical protein
MTTALERQVLAQPLQDFVTGVDPNIVVEWPNKTINKPDDAIWLRFSISTASANQIEIGSIRNTGRTVGAVIIQIFAPIDSGDGDAIDLGDALVKLYQRQVFNFDDDSGTVRCRDGTVKSVGRTDSYYQWNVVVPFHRDDLQ